MKDKFTITIGIKSLEALHMFYNFRSSALSWYKEGTDLQKQIYAESIETLKQIELILAELPKNEVIEMRKGLVNVFNDTVESITNEIKELENK